MDLAAVAPPGVVDVALDVAVASRLVAIRSLDSMLAQARARGVPGITQLRRSIAEYAAGAVPASILERRMESLLRSYGLTGAARELPVGPGGQYRADFAFARAKVLVEVDGFRTHGSRDAFQEDVRRQNRLVCERWTPLRYTWWDLERRAEEVAAEIDAVLTANSPPGNCKQ